jgi:hypothetical protein
VHDPREHFALANRHVVEADERIAGQRHRIERLRQAGHDTAASEDLLLILLETRNLLKKTVPRIAPDRTKAKKQRPNFK